LGAVCSGTHTHTLHTCLLIVSFVICRTCQHRACALTYCALTYCALAYCTCILFVSFVICRTCQHRVSPYTYCALAYCLCHLSFAELASIAPVQLHTVHLYIVCVICHLQNLPASRVTLYMRNALPEEKCIQCT